MKNKGFTIVEVMIAGFLMVSLGVGIIGLQYVLTKSQTSSFTNAINTEEANLVVSQIVKELREATDSDSGAYPIETAEDNQIVFYSDVDGDGYVEKVRYFLSGKTLTRGVIEPVGTPADYPAENEQLKTITENIENGVFPIFHYYNSDWPTDTTNNPLPEGTRIASTRLVSVSIIINNSTDPLQNYVVESVVQIRRLKDNL